MRDFQNRTFYELIQQIIFRHPKLFPKDVDLEEILNTIATLVYEDAQMHTEADDMVICLLYDKGKELWEEKTNH